MNVQNMFHSLVCSWKVQLALGTALILGYFCDNNKIIGLVLVCLPSGSTDVTASPSQYIMTQPSRISILSPVLFMNVGDPNILLL